MMLEDPVLSPLLLLPAIDPTLSPPVLNARVNNLWESYGWFRHVVQGIGRDDVETAFGQENERRNIVLAVNSDGFQPFSNIQYSMNPFVCMILNLPENLRHKPDYLLLAAVIPGKKAPTSFQTYLQMFVNELNELWHDKPIRITVPATKKEMDIRVKLLQTCADYPAHGDLNCQQGSMATYGCIKCLIEVSRQTACERSGGERCHRKADGMITH